MKLKLLFFCLIIPNIVYGMEVTEGEAKNRWLFFKTFHHMNELDLDKPGYQNAADFGESIGYLIEHPVEHWLVPKTEKEKEITIQWIKKLYAHKDHKILQHMINDLLYKIATQDELYDFILQKLKPEKKKVQKKAIIVIDLLFRKKELLEREKREEKDRNWLWPCLAL